jgi:hypothetical protein
LPHFGSTGGDFYFKDWHVDRSKTLGLLLQQGAHDLDVIHRLATRAEAMGALSVNGDIADRRDNRDRRMRDSAGNGPPTTPTGMAPVLDVEDISMANFLLDNGVLACYQQCHFTYRSQRAGTLGPDPVLVAEFLRFAQFGGPTLTSPVAARNAVPAGVAPTTSLRSGGEVVAIPPLRPEIEDLLRAFPDPPAPRPLSTLLLRSCCWTVNSTPAHTKRRTSSLIRKRMIRRLSGSVCGSARSTAGVSTIMDQG